MCDYSLHHVASRPAKVGDKLVATDFVRSITRGFAAVGEPTSPSVYFRARNWLLKKTSNTSALSACSAERAWITRLPDSGRSTWTIRTSTTTRSNSRAARS